MVGYQVDDGSQIFTMKKFVVSPVPSIKRWLFGVPGWSLEFVDPIQKIDEISSNLSFGLPFVFQPYHRLRTSLLGHKKPAQK